MYLYRSIYLSWLQAIGTYRGCVHYMQEFFVLSFVEYWPIDGLGG